MLAVSGTGLLLAGATDRKLVTFRVVSSERLYRANAFRMSNINFSIVTKFAHVYL
jgi:hypothetical protein